MKEFILCSYYSYYKFLLTCENVHDTTKENRCDIKYNKTVSSSIYWEFTMYQKCDWLTYFILRTIQNNNTLLFYRWGNTFREVKKLSKFTQLVSSRVWFEPVFGRFQSFSSKHIHHITFNNHNFSYILKYTKKLEWKCMKGI